MCRVPDLDAGHCAGERIDELVVDQFVDNDALGGVAGLSGVAEAAHHGLLGRALDVGVLKYQERIRAAEFEHDLLQVAAGDLRHGRAGALGAGERDALNAGIGDHVGDLLVGGEDVHVGAVRGAGVGEDLLHGQRGLGALRGVLEQDRVAVHQVRRGEAGDLVVGEVPRHDAQQHTHALLADQRGAAGCDLQLLIRQELLAVGRVVAVDRDGDVDFLAGLEDRLAHFAGDDRGQLVAAFLVEVRDAGQQRGARERWPWCSRCRRRHRRGPVRPAMSASVAVG